jgi:hypothetical protein
METNEERKYVCYDRRFLSTGMDIANMILLTEIENLSKLPNGCYATDEQLGRLILICAKNTNERIKFLEKCGYIKCNTTFVNKKRRRSISFTFVEGNPSQDGITKRSHKKKVNLSQDGLPYPPQDGYNKLYNEVNTDIPKIENEKENGEFGPSIGPKKENNVDTPFFFQFDIQSEELPANENTSTNSSPVSLNDIKKSKVLNLDFLKKVKDNIAFMDYDELIEHLNGEFQDYFPLSQFEKYQLEVIINSK